MDNPELEDKVFGRAQDVLSALSALKEAVYSTGMDFEEVLEEIINDFRCE